jgi:hypothetical protein
LLKKSKIIQILGVYMADYDYQYWYDQIGQYDRAFKKWEGRAEKIVKRYRDDSRSQNNPTSRFNILWSNVQTVTPAIFARLPKPDVSRRFRDTDPVGRVASMMLERGLDYELEHYSDYKTAMKSAVFDRLMGGRGTAWVRYEPTITSYENEEMGEMITEDVEGYDNEEISNECCPIDYIHYKDFCHSNGRTWEEITWIGRKVYMNRNALIDRFGDELGRQIPLDSKPDTGKSYEKTTNYSNQACIYEIWCKESNKVYWISKSLGEILEEQEDPLELEGFFPCPKPLYSTLTTDNLEPIPDYAMYQDQARELDELADKIDGLIKALKVRGVYDASSTELQRLFSEGENNTLIPVANWGAFAEKSGLKGAIDLVDIQPFATALMTAYQAMDQVKGQIYEIMGIADIQRGQTDPNETLGAQIIKSNNASGRLKTMQHDVVDFATKLLQIKAQIICKHFQPETIIKISAVDQLRPQDQQVVPFALELLKSGDTASFRIEVTSDSMVYQNEQQDKADRMEFLNMASGFLEKFVGIGQQAPDLVPVAMEMLKFAVTGFNAGKQLEGMIDETADKLKEIAAQPKQPQPNPEMMKLQAQAQMKQQEMQMAAQIKQQEMQMEIQVEKSKQEYQAQENTVKNQLEQQRNEADRQAQFALEKFKIETEKQKEILLRYLDTATKLETARISAGLTDGSASYIDATETVRNLTDTIGYPDMAQHPLAPVIDNMNASNQQMTQMLMELINKIHESSNRPKQIIRDQSGKVIGVH